MNIENIGKKALVIPVVLLLTITLAACSSNAGDSIETPKQIEAGTDKNADEILRDYARWYGTINQRIQDFELVDLDGQEYVLSELQGKIVFLNFWATWCPPCREEMPHMQIFYDKYKDDDVIILAVNPESVENRGSGSSHDAKAKAGEFIDENGYTFPVLLDPDNSVWGAYQQRGIPANYIIDAKGIIRYLKPGAFTGVEEMEAFLEAARISLDN